MDFQTFATAHGVDIHRLDHGRITRCPTLSHPRKKNGAYLFNGDFGWVQDWAQHPEPVYWHDQNITKPNDLAALRARMEASRKQHAQERAREAHAAAKRAQTIINAAVHEKHAYLDAKGWQDKGLVWYPSEGVNLLVIPMRINGALAGCQLIDRDGNKRFLKGQRTSGAEYVFGSAGTDIFSEGWATARSIHECISATGMRARVHACFSACNLQRIAKTGFVVADNDASQTGEKAAIATGLPYYLPETGDFNDLHRAAGTFTAGMELHKTIFSMKALRA